MNIIWVLLLFIHAARHNHMGTCLLHGEIACIKTTKTNRCDWSSYTILASTSVCPSRFTRRSGDSRKATSKRTAQHCVVLTCWCVLSSEHKIYTERVTYISLGHRWFSKRTIVKVLTSNSIATAACDRRNTKISKQIFDVCRCVQPPQSLCSVHLCCCLYVRSCLFVYNSTGTLEVIQCFFPQFSPSFHYNFWFIFKIFDILYRKIPNFAAIFVVFSENFPNEMPCGFVWNFDLAPFSLNVQSLLYGQRAHTYVRLILF